MSSPNKNRSVLILALISAALVILAFYFVFVVVPNERVMGAVQRIFYFHVGSAIASYFSIAALLLSALVYLATRSERSDCTAVASTEVSFVLCTAVLLSGMIWGRSAWNTWFRFEPRLVSFLLLWLILGSMLLLRQFGDKQKVAMQSAVLAVLAAVNIPLVVFSVKLLPQSAQLHPQVLENRGLKDPSYWKAFALATVAMIFVQALLIVVRTRIEAAERRCRSMTER